MRTLLVTFIALSCCAALMLVGAVVGLTLASRPHRSLLRATWTAGIDGNPPARFRVLEIPASEQIPLFDAPHGQPAGMLQRALLNTREELSEPWIAVQGERVAWAQRDDITADLSSPFRDALVQALVDALAGRRLTLDVSIAEESHSTRHVVITLTSPDDSHRWAYLETSGHTAHTCSSCPR